MPEEKLKLLRELEKEGLVRETGTSARFLHFEVLDYRELNRRDGRLSLFYQEYLTIGAIRVALPVPSLA